MITAIVIGLAYFVIVAFVLRWVHCATSKKMPKPEDEVMPAIKWVGWGIYLGPLAIVWWDCFKKHPCLEITWKYKIIFTVG